MKGGSAFKAEKRGAVVLRPGAMIDPPPGAGEAIDVDTVDRALARARESLKAAGANGELDTRLPTSGTNERCRRAHGRSLVALRR